MPNFNFEPRELLRRYGSPLYVYDENILRERCREMKTLVSYPNFEASYSAKANGNLYLLKVVRSEGLSVDAMSPGEIFAAEKAGFLPGEIFYIPNNVSGEEMAFAVSRGVTVSVDSLSQLELFGRINPGGRVSVRLNPGVGAGHHEKVVTGGKDTKFGINLEYLPELKETARKSGLKIIGINQHIGSLFMEGSPYTRAAENLLGEALSFPDLEFIDLGGGFGVPYRKKEGEKRLDLKALGARLDELMFSFAKAYGREISFKTEPGRYIAAECGVLLGTVHSVKHNGETKYIGTDLGLNVLARPVMYGAYHEVEIYAERAPGKRETVTVVGNICETGDIIAKDRLLPEAAEGDVIAALDAGAYGYCMSGNYNNRPRPAEVFIRPDGGVVLTRRRDTLEDMVRNFEDV